MTILLMFPSVDCDHLLISEAGPKPGKLRDARRLPELPRAPVSVRDIPIVFLFFFFFFVV